MKFGLMTFSRMMSHVMEDGGWRMDGGWKERWMRTRTRTRIRTGKKGKVGAPENE